MKNAILAASFIVLFAMASNRAAYADEGGKFSLETGVDHNTGKYGGTQSTDVWYVPFTLKYQDQSWTLKLIVPYLQITGPGSAIDVMNGVTATGNFTAAPVTRSGLGDLIAAATHNAYNGGPSGFIINVTGKIKFGTASLAQGMGTGANDYAFQSDIYQVTGNFTAFGALGYRIYGSPPGYTLLDGFYGSLGGSYKFSEETYGGISLNLGQKIISTGSFHRQAMLFVGRKLDKNWKAQGYVLKGFSNSVPDSGAGVSLAYAF